MQNPIFFRIRNPEAVDTLEKYQRNDACFRQRVEGRDFIDMGCGSEHLSIYGDISSLRYTSMAAFVRALGARRYLGVDLDLKGNRSRSEDHFDLIYVRDEILHFLATIPDNYSVGKVFFFSGIESIFEPRVYKKANEFFSDHSNQGKKFEDALMPMPWQQLIVYFRVWKEVAEYHQALYDELRRVTQRGDSVFLGSRTTSFDRYELINRGFRGCNDFFVRK